MPETYEVAIPVFIDGVPFLLVSDELRAWPGGSNGGNGGNGSLPVPDWKETELLWKQKGTSAHPKIMDGTFQASAFVLGHLAIITAKLTFGPETTLGGDTQERYWFFQPVDEKLLPDFDNPKTIESTLGFHAWHDDNNQQFDGSAYWTKNVGSGIDGIRLSRDGSDSRYEVGPKTVAWKSGDSIRFTVIYRRASSEV